MRTGLTLITLCAAVALAGCQGTGIWPGSRQSQPLPPTQPQSLSSQSQQPTLSNDTFPPPPPTTDNAFPAEPTTQAGARELQPVAANAPEVTRASVVGRWTITAGGNPCDLFMALTPWAGGYRAASRGCSGQAALIQSWDVVGTQVVLIDSNGNRFAQFQRSGEQRFEGMTATGETASLSR